MSGESAETTVVALPGRDTTRDLLGRPMRDLRISVMDRCNFRCPYCMPRETFHERYRFLRSSERLDFSEITRVARLGTALGVRKVRITGGEPLLRPGIADLVAELSTLDGVEDIALTTNGVLLAQHAAELKGNGLHRVTVSLDSLDAAVFEQMSGGFGGLDQVLEGIEAALAAGLDPVKVNTVVKRGVNDHTVLALLGRFRGTKVIVRLIEYMDVGNRNDWHATEVVTSAELLKRIGEHWPVIAVPGRRRSEVAERYRYVDGAGELGFISSVSTPFCGGCSRARLSSEGALYTCLFAADGLDLRAPLRAGATDEELIALLRGAWSRRSDRYSENRDAERAAAHPLRKVEMHYIGG
jgi:cyclic pyranopterin phosphate synthase